MANTPTLIQPIDVVLRAIREERSFRQAFSVVASSITDKIYSFYTNANCSCKSTIIDWINNNVDKTNELLTKNEATIAAMAQDVKKAASIIAPTANSNKSPTPNAQQNLFSTPNSKVGKIINIEKKDEAYASLMKKSIDERWIYRGVSIVPNIVDGVEVWSVFFF